jgi:hypothetical protein
MARAKVHSNRQSQRMLDDAVAKAAAVEMEAQAQLEAARTAASIARPHPLVSAGNSCGVKTHFGSMLFADLVTGGEEMATQGRACVKNMCAHV